MRKKLLVLSIVTLSLFSVPVLSYAQSDGPEQVFAGDTTDENAPIDGGVSLLVAAGVAYGLAAVKKSRKEEKDNQNC